MRKTALAACVMLGLALPLQKSIAHGGGLNSSGCHREKATGGYHCHRSSGSSSKSSSEKTWGKSEGRALIAIVGAGLSLWLLNESLRNDERTLASKSRLLPHISEKKSDSRPDTP